MAVSNRDRLPGEAGGSQGRPGGEGRPTAPAIQILSPMVGERKTFSRRTDQIVKQMGELRLHCLDERGSIPHLISAHPERKSSRTRSAPASDLPATPI